MKKRVKDWEELLRIGSFEDNAVYYTGCSTFFDNSMRKYCGKTLDFRIESPGYYKLVKGEGWSFIESPGYYKLVKGEGWSFRDWMLESEAEAVERLLNEYEGQN
jgi:hypothetical protein